MVEQKKILEKKLKKINNNLIGNAIFLIISVLVLLFVPWINFDNFEIQISLEVIIALITLIISLVESSILRHKKENIEEELLNYNKDTKEKLFTCENCGEMVYNDDKFCPKCGAKFESDEIECPECHTLNSKENKYCSKCGYEFYEEVYECEYCGKTFKTEERTKEHFKTCAKKKEYDKRIGDNFLIFLLIISFICLSFLFIQYNIYLFIIPLFMVCFVLSPLFKLIKPKNIQNISSWKIKFLIILFILFLTYLIYVLMPSCPNTCNDGNSCTNDFCSSKTGFKCMNTLKLNCMGNNICEVGEYGISDDCPKCNDEDACTIDSFDYSSKECIHTEMKNCVN